MTIDANRVFVRNLLTSWGSRLTTLFVTFAITPLLVSSLGTVGYGLWAVGFAFTSFLSLADFGMNAGLVRMVGHSNARGERYRVRHYVVIALSFYLLLGTLLVVVTWLVRLSLVELLQVPVPLRPQAILFLIGVTALLVINNIAGVFTSMLNGLEAVHISSLLNLGGGLLNAATIAVALVAFHLNIVGLIFASVLVAAMWSVIVAFVGARRIGGIFPVTGLLSRERLKEFAGFSLGMQVSNVAGVINFSVDKFVLAAITGLATAGLYDLGSRLTLVISVFSGLIGGAGFPTAVRLNHTSTEEFQHFCLEVESFLILCSCGLAGLLVTVANPLVGAWLGPDHEGVVVAARLLAISSAGFALSVAPSMALWALGRIKEVTIFNLLRTALHIVLSILLTARFGFMGALIGALIALLSSSLWFSLTTRHYFGEGALAWLIRRLGRPVAAALVSSSFVLVLSGLPTIAQAISSTPVSEWVTVIATGAVFASMYIGLLVLLRVFTVHGLQSALRLAVSGFTPGSPSPLLDEAGVD